MRSTTRPYRLGDVLRSDTLSNYKKMAADRIKTFFIEQYRRYNYLHPSVSHCNIRGVSTLYLIYILNVSVDIRVVEEKTTPQQVVP